MCIFIKISIISPIFTSKCQHGQYRTLKVEYFLPMPVFIKIIVLYNFRYKKLYKSCTQLLRYKEPVPYLPVNASMDNTVRIQKVEYYQCRHILKSMTIVVLYNFRYKKLSKLCIQLLRCQPSVPYLPVNASMDNTVL